MTMDVVSTAEMEAKGQAVKDRLAALEASLQFSTARRRLPFAMFVSTVHGAALLHGLATPCLFLPPSLCSWREKLKLTDAVRRLRPTPTRRSRLPTFWCADGDTLPRSAIRSCSLSPVEASSSGSPLGAPLFTQIRAHRLHHAT